jgi:phage major head subunit gpT-like protein
MELTPTVAQALYTKYSQIFQNAFLASEIFWPKFAQIFNSTAEVEQHIWLDRIPQLRAWNGDRIIQNASLRSYSLPNLPFELTLELDEFKVRDNKIDAFAPTVQMMAMQSKKWPDKLFFDPVIGAIVAGGTIVTYDGQPFWSASHPINTDVAALGSQSNLVNVALSATNYFNGRAAMAAYKGADSLPLYVTPDLLVGPTTTEATALQILNTTYIAPSVALGANAASVMQENPLKGTADYLKVPDMNALIGVSIGGFSGTPWMLLDSSKSIKPFLFQLREAPQFVFNVKPDSPSVFSRHALQYGVRTRGNGGFGPWFFAYLGTA